MTNGGRVDNREDDRFHPRRAQSRFARDCIPISTTRRARFSDAKEDRVPRTSRDRDVKTISMNELNFEKFFFLFQKLAREDSHFSILR